MNSLFKRRLVAEALIGIFAAPFAIASSLTLPTVPLLSDSNMAPNVMLLIDTSTSMYNIVPDSPYDADSYSYACSNSVPDSVNVNIVINADGTAQYRIGGEGDTTYSFGNSGSNYCFSDDEEYRARLYANDPNGEGPPYDPWDENYGYGTYTGRYLNWYFENFTIGASGPYQRNETYTRIGVAKDAAKEMVTSSLDGMRVALAEYHNYDGAIIKVNIADDDDSGTHQATLTNAIEVLHTRKSTPSGEALADMGRYFTLGYSASSNLTLHPNDTSPIIKSVSEIFPHTLVYEGISAPDVDGDEAVCEAWCQDSYVVLLTDGQTNNDDNLLEFSDLIDYVADSEGSSVNDTSAIVDDVALALYEMDLRPDLVDDDGDAVTNNLTTHIVGFEDENATFKTTMMTTASNGGGKYIGATDSEELADAFDDIAATIADETAAMSSVSFNTTELTASSVLYSGEFNTLGWTGSLSAYNLDATTGDISTTANWEASDQLEALTGTTSSGDYSNGRNILTYTGTTGIEFLYANLASLSDTQKDDLALAPDSNSQNMINFIIGDDANEGTASNSYRMRTSLLGDIVNSSTVYVGDPELSWPDYSTANTFFGASGDDYSTFKSSTAATTRTEMVYVGANDGMLHGFEASTGDEKLAYIPNAIFSSDTGAGLHYLADTGYTHQFYVDLTPTVSDVYISSAWHTVLVGGLRAGGKGLFALDVTTPGDFDSLSTKADDIVLWEFSHEDDEDFGYSYSKPKIAMMNNGKWAVIVGNGYNNNGTNSSGDTGSGTASLFILFIEEGSDGTWNAADYVKIDTKVGDTTTPNGLSTPTVVDTDGDSDADRIYAGDLQGNMWVFDVSGVGSGSWASAFGTPAAPDPLFTAVNDDSVAQPITSAPSITSNSASSAGAPNLLVLFGTGKYLEESDITSNVDVMSYYAVLDAGVGEKDRDDLESRTLLTKTVGTEELRTITGTADWSNSKSGWYFDLVERENATDTAAELGERVISESTIDGDILYFTSNIPSATECSSGGDHWDMSLSIETGLAATFATYDADGDGTIEQTSAEDGGDISYVGSKDSSMSTGGGTMLGDNLYDQLSDGTDEKEETYNESSVAGGRYSWEEMFNN